MDNRAENNLDLLLTRHLDLYIIGRDFSANTTGARLREARLAKHMTIKELSIATGISEGSILKMEHDKVFPKLVNLRSFSELLGVKVSYLGRFEDLPENTTGQRITKARLYQGLTMDEFSKIINVHVKKIRYMERDIIEPSTEQMEILSPYLDIINTEYYR